MSPTVNCHFHVFNKPRDAHFMTLRMRNCAYCNSPTSASKSSWSLFSMGSCLMSNLSIPFVRLCSSVICYFSITLFSTFFILFFKISLCAEAHLESSQTSTGLIIWSFPFRAEFLRPFSVTVSEAAVRSCSIIKFAKLCNIHRKAPVTESLYDAIFSSYWKTKSKSKTQICEHI